MALAAPGAHGRFIACSIASLWGALGAIGRNSPPNLRQPSNCWPQPTHANTTVTPASRKRSPPSRHKKRAVLTPAQIVRELPREIGLPSPLVLQSAANSSVPNQTDKHPAGNATPADNAKQAETQAVIPAADLKPLYDFAIDCKPAERSLPPRKPISRRKDQDRRAY